jgi:hypothetical protein
MKIIRSGSVLPHPARRPILPAACASTLFQTDAPARVGGAIVTFEPGRARPGTPIRWVRR